MARIFIGLVKCGAWGCFDEFNRLEEATLSAVSMQIQPIQTAIKFGHESVKLLDEKVSNSMSIIKFLQYVLIILAL
jgi:dynein heavy chain 2